MMNIPSCWIILIFELGFMPSFLRAFPTNASAVFMFELVMKLLSPEKIPL